jgi:hypothetical protein
MMSIFCACRGNGGGGDAKTRALDPTMVTRVELVEKTFDFGNIKQGEVVGHTFRVKNAGEKDLFLQEIESGCGCTTARYTRKPIRPGEEGTIEVRFDSGGRFGKQYKTVRVTSNIREGSFELVVKANVTGR